MTGPELKRSVGDAVGAAQDVARQAQVVRERVGPPPVAGEGRRVRTSVAAAADSLRSLAAYGRTMNPNFSVSIPTTGSPAGQLSAEAHYGSSARGHERPERTFATAEAARAHSREEDAASRALFMLRYPEARLTDSTATRVPRAGELERMADDVRGWFGPGVLGRSVAERFVRTPPVVTGETQQYFRLVAATNGLIGQTVALQYPGTNHIAVDAEGIFEADRYPSEAERRCILAHEMFHYSAMLGGGYSLRWRGPNGEPVFREVLSWLHEGMTELHAQQMTRGRGHVPPTVSYAAETTVSFYLQQLVGADVLRNAYLTGDLSEVRRLVDRRLGAGTFEAIADAGSGASAFFYLRGRLGERGMPASLASWDRDAIVRTAGVVEEHREAEEERRGAERDPNAIHGSR